jgi:(p)ppGpp synthase/HD superfamily hydrolase
MIQWRDAPERDRPGRQSTETIDRAAPPASTEMQATHKLLKGIWMLTERFDGAFRYAHRLPQKQWRKGTSIPYISHLMTVAALVIEHGGDEDQAIAGLLHDAAEDQGGDRTLAEIRAKFGDQVANIVADCTDAWTEPKPPWRPRKEAYLKALPNKPAASLLVSLADKTHNAEAILF